MFKKCILKKNQDGRLVNRNIVMSIENSAFNKIAVEKSGTYTVYVRDMLGNTATKTIDVVIIEDSNESGKDDNASGKKENGDAAIKNASK